VKVEGDDLAPVTGAVRGFEKYCGQGPLDLGIYNVDASTRGLGDAYVSVDGGSDDFRREGPFVLDQAGCVFKPAVLVMPPGTLLVKNSDTMPHNVTTEGKLNPLVKESFFPAGAISARFPFEEVVRVRCSIHPWMQAALIITNRAAHALTDRQGRFRLERVEAGRRRVRAWHLLGEEVSVEVDVPADGVVEVEIPWKPRPGFRAPFGR
jgi:plastocyanin